MKPVNMLLSALLLLLFTAASSGQALKLGFVDSQKIFEGLPEAQKVKRELDVKVQVWRDSLETMSKSFQQQYETYQQQQGTMAEAANKARQQELLKMQGEIQEYQQKKFGQDGEAAALQRRFLAPLKDKVLRAIEDVAKKEKLNFIFDKIEEASLLLYADAKYDYTNLVLDYLKRGSN
ncbi:MAG: OmpH family outer membrane protein [Ignavibacteria bacterium]|nr:OmpH family outer membrane protein [Ignavibacteria bacterium]